MFLIVSYFHPSLIFVGKAERLMSWALGSISSAFFMCGIFKAFLRTDNCDLQMTTSTAKCNLQMAQPAQFLDEKAWWNSFLKTRSFLSFTWKKPCINMLMKMMQTCVFHSDFKWAKYFKALLIQHPNND